MHEKGSPPRLEDPPDGEGREDEASAAEQEEEEERVIGPDEASTS